MLVNCCAHMQWKEVSYKVNFQIVYRHALNSISTCTSRSVIFPYESGFARAEDRESRGHLSLYPSKFVRSVIMVTKPLSPSWSQSLTHHHGHRASLTIMVTEPLSPSWSQNLAHYHGLSTAAILVYLYYIGDDKASNSMWGFKQWFLLQTYTSPVFCRDPTAGLESKSWPSSWNIRS